MKKFFLSFFVIVVSAGYVVYQYIGGTTVSASTPIAAVPTTHQTTRAPVSTESAPTTPTKIVTTPSPAPTPAPAPKPTPVTTPVPTPQPVTPPPPVKPKGQYADGTYTGAAADAYYGNIQVQAVIQGGKLTDVIFLQYPNDRRTSQHINDQAMPYLKSEAIQAQSANVSGVSGASDSSQAFVQSLGDALSQAKNS